jgi:hypothetical protein
MTQDIKDLEKDIEESRARLDLTIDRIQDKLSVSGIVDDMIGSARKSGYAPVFDSALAAIRRNPVPVMLVVAGVGWLLHRMSEDSVRTRRTRRVAYAERAGVRPVEPGHARIYDDPDLSIQPAQDTLEIRREVDARA